MYQPKNHSLETMPGKKVDGVIVIDPFQVTWNGCDYNTKTEVHKGLTTKFVSSINIHVTSEPRKVVSQTPLGYSSFNLVI